VTDWPRDRPPPWEEIEASLRRVSTTLRPGVSRGPNMTPTGNYEQFLEAETTAQARITAALTRFAAGYWQEPAFTRWLLIADVEHGFHALHSYRGDFGLFEQLAVEYAAVRTAELAALPPETSA
jgi:hypothetical protein